MVHHTPTKARARSVPVLLHPCCSILGVLCGQYGYDPLAWLLVQLYINPTYVPTDELIDGWSSWYITHHPRKEQEVCQFLSINAGPSLDYCVTSMDMTPLFWLIVQWQTNLTHEHIDELRGVPTHV